MTGTMESADRNSALQMLSEKYPLVVELKEIKSRRSLLGFWKRPPSSEEVLAFFQQLSVAISAGVPLKSCLDTMADDSANPQMQVVVFAISSDLTAGSPLSAAMERHPGVFSAYQPKLVRAGEASGKISEVLAQLATDMEGREVLMAQVKSALAYPAVVLSVAGLLAGCMLAWGVPQVKTIFDDMGAKLPLPTQILVWIGLSLSGFWWLWLVTIAGLAWGIKTAWKSAGLRATAELALLNTYAVGPLFRLLNVSAFARTLGLLYRAGLPLSQALEILSDTSTSQTMTHVIKTLQARVTHGETLSSAMRGTGYFPSMAIEMVSTGENSGALEKMLRELDRFYSRRCEYALKSLTSLIEPLLAVGVGILLGGVILGLALPFLSLPALLM